MKKFILLILLLALGLTACNAGGEEVVVSDAWGRTSPMAAQNGAFYMVIQNNTNQDDALIAARSDSCGTVELHESYMKEEGVMGMRPVPDGQIPIPAGGTAELKAGGLHIMCIDKQAEFNTGDQATIVLEFANAGEKEIAADIRTEAP